MKKAELPSQPAVGQRYAYIAGGAPMDSEQYLQESFSLAKEGAAQAQRQQWKVAAQKVEQALNVVRRGKPYFANRSDVYKLFETREAGLLGMLRNYQSFGQVSKHDLRAAYAARAVAHTVAPAHLAPALQAPPLPDEDNFDPASARVVVDTQVTWDDIIGMEDVKRTLREAIEQPLVWPQLYVGKYFAPWKGILLYGPPGTGKTMMAKAAASGARCAFFEVRASDLLNKWLGDSEQRVRALFAQARKSERAIIFVDECDALFRRRSDRESDVVLRVKTEFFTGMDGLTSNDSIMVIGATNAPGDLDDAILRRFEKRLMVPVPDLAARVAMFEKVLTSLDAAMFTKADFAAFASATAYYTGDDIRIVIKAATELARRRIITASHFCQDATGEARPCEPGAPGAFARPSATAALNVKLRILRQDIEEAIHANPPAVGAERLRAYNDPFAAELQGRDDETRGQATKPD